MSSILNIAVSGLNDATARAANAASNIVNVEATNYLPQDVITLSNSVAGNNLGVSTLFQPSPLANPTPPVTAPTDTASPSLPVPTSTADLAANLPAQEPVGFTSSATIVSVYDNLGATHNLSLSFTKTGINTWNVNLRAEDGASPSLSSTADATTTVPLTFNSSGNPGTLASVGPGAGYTVSGGSAILSLNFPGAGKQNLSLSFGTPGTSSGITQFADPAGVTVSSFEQNGSAYGASPVSTGAIATPPTSPDNGVDIATNLVTIKAAQTNYGANAAVIKIADKLEKALLDIKT